MSHCHNSCCSTEAHSHDHQHTDSGDLIKSIILASLSFVILFSGIIMEHFGVTFFMNPWIPIFWYGIPFILVGFPVLKEGILLIVVKKDFFNEITLMSVATLGAWAIGEYAEGLGVMVFYTIGEVFQSMAVTKSRNNIKALLDVRPDSATVERNGSFITIDPKEVKIDEIIEVRTGEKVPLDGVLITEKATFNTAALTGESVPRTIRAEEEVLAGMLSTAKTIKIRVTKIYEDSTLSRILKMVQDASENKSPTEQFIRKFARVYTPIVFGLAILVIVVPIFVLGTDYRFTEWFYRSLVFLVISCPCALVISVPLGYFGGIGLGSRYGILFKGGNYLEAMTHLKTLVTDKTGTITKGVFSIQKIFSEDQPLLLSYLASIEKHSTHPIAKAIVEYTTTKNISILEIDNVEDIAGKGLKGQQNHQTILVGNSTLMSDHQIKIPQELLALSNTVVFVAIDNIFLGAVIVADEIKEDTPLMVQQLHKLDVNIIMLSGDRQSIVTETAESLGIDQAYGDLLPDGKAGFVEGLKAQKSSKDIIAFVGDGINDAPVLALSDVGIAMGGLGSDLAIETADIIIQTDEPSKIPLAVHIAKATRKIVLQNIVLAMGIKIIILILGVNGLASMWEAIFADVGVSLIAILNSSRLLYKKFS